MNRDFFTSPTGQVVLVAAVLALGVIAVRWQQVRRSPAPLPAAAAAPATVLPKTHNRDGARFKVPPPAPAAMPAAPTVTPAPAPVPVMEKPAAFPLVLFAAQSPKATSSPRAPFAPYGGAGSIKTQHGEVEFFPNEFGTAWTTNNEAHWYAWQFFRTRMYERDGISLTHAASGHLRLRDLEKWPSELFSEQTRPAALRKMASDLHVFLLQSGTPGALLEEGVTANSAQSTLAGLLKEGDTKLAEFGPAVDSLYSFKRERSHT